MWNQDFTKLVRRLFVFNGFYENISNSDFILYLQRRASADGFLHTLSQTPTHTEYLSPYSGGSVRFTLCVKKPGMHVVSFLIWSFHSTNKSLAVLEPHVCWLTDIIISLHCSQLTYLKRLSASPLELCSSPFLSFSVSGGLDKSPKGF